MMMTFSRDAFCDDSNQNNAPMKHTLSSSISSMELGSASITRELTAVIVP
jgi:hypothetical protein